MKQSHADSADVTKTGYKCVVITSDSCLSYNYLTRKGKKNKNKKLKRTSLFLKRSFTLQQFPSQPLRQNKETHSYGKFEI